MGQAVQDQLRRGFRVQLASATGAVGELFYDTDNNQVIGNDGSTAGGFPMQSHYRVPVNNANYTMNIWDRIIAYTAIAAARTVQLCAANAVPAGASVILLDESGSASGTNTITPLRAGGDTINGATTAPAAAIISVAFGGVRLISNGSTKWTVAP